VAPHGRRATGLADKAVAHIWHRQRASVGRDGSQWDRPGPARGASWRATSQAPQRFSAPDKRRVWDSNPREACAPSGFQDHDRQRADLRKRARDGACWHTIGTRLACGGTVRSTFAPPVFRARQVEPRCRRHVGGLQVLVRLVAGRPSSVLRTTSTRHTQEITRLVTCQATAGTTAVGRCRRRGRADVPAQPGIRSRRRTTRGGLQPYSRQGSRGIAPTPP